jgi:hypothetical protein
LFKIVCPTHHCFYKTRIDLFLEFVSASVPSLHLKRDFLPQAIFFLAEQEPGDVYGGAILYPVTPQDLSGSLLSSSDTWQVVPCLLSDHKIITSAPDSQKAIKNFYKNLFGHIHAFAKERGIGFSCLALGSCEYDQLQASLPLLDSRNPYKIDFLPRSSSQELCEGILSFLDTSSDFPREKSLFRGLNSYERKQVA